MSKLIIHNVQEVWNNNYLKYGVSYNDYIKNIIDWIEQNKDFLDIDEVIIIRSEEVDNTKMEELIEDKFNINIGVYKYGSGWSIEEIDILNFEKWNADNKIVDENGAPLKLYRGSEDGEMQSGFFSTSKEFSKDFGDIIEEHIISLKNPFDSLNVDHLQVLINSVDEIEDPFDNQYYDNVEDLIDNVGSDTWSALENYSADIEALGFDGIIIYEGGYKNFLVFNPSDTNVKYWQEVIFLLEGEKNLTWCPANSINSKGSDMLFIPDFIKDIKDERVFIAGAFEGGHINNLEKVLNSIDINFERIEGLIVGSGVEYKPSNIAVFKNKFKDFMIDDDFDNALRLFNESEVIRAHNEIISFLIRTGEDIDKIIDGFDFDSNFIKEWLEKIKESKEDGLISSTSLVGNLKGGITVSLCGDYYHGSALESVEELMGLDCLSVDYSDLNSVYVSESSEAVEFFAQSKINDDNKLGVILKFHLDIDNIFKIDLNGEYFFFDGVEYHVSSDREEYFEHMQRSGYNGVILENNYGENSDIALFDDIMVDENTCVSIKNNNHWGEFRKIKQERPRNKKNKI